MEIADLYNNLKAAYTPDNLNLISGRIIHMFQEHQYDGLRAVQKAVNEYTPCAEEKINKVFARLIMFYHPDRLSQSLDLLEKAYSEGDFEQLFSMSHILHVKNLEPGQLTVSSIITDEDIAEEFGWDGADDGYSYFMDQEEDPELDDDLSPLFELTHLNYLNVMGNRIPLWQLEKLQENGVSVVH